MVGQPVLDSASSCEPTGRSAHTVFPPRNRGGVADSGGVVGDQVQTVEALRSGGGVLAEYGQGGVGIADGDGEPVAAQFEPDRDVTVDAAVAERVVDQFGEDELRLDAGVGDVPLRTGLGQEAASAPVRVEVRRQVQASAPPRRRGVDGVQPGGDRGADVHEIDQSAASEIEERGGLLGDQDQGNAGPIGEAVGEGGEHRQHGLAADLQVVDYDKKRARFVRGEFRQLVGE